MVYTRTHWEITKQLTYTNIPTPKFYGSFIILNMESITLGK